MRVKRDKQDQRGWEIDLIHGIKLVDFRQSPPSAFEFGLFLCRMRDKLLSAHAKS